MFKFLFYFESYVDVSTEIGQELNSKVLSLQVYEVDVLEGDTIIMGSDGLFDNVYDAEIETTLRILGSPDEDFPSRAGMSHLNSDFNLSSMKLLISI